MVHIRNYVMLDEPSGDVTFKVGRVEDGLRKEITDRVTGQLKTVAATDLVLSEADGHAVDARLSILSDKLYALFRPYIESGTITARTFRLRWSGQGFRREYSLDVVT